MRLSLFFIDRPVFAWVIAIVVALAGILAIYTLPITQYPTIAPPAVTISAFYPGASAETAQNSVTQVIEQQLTGVDNLLYFDSSSSSDGGVQITATFAPGTNPDIAQVQVAKQSAAGHASVAGRSAAAGRRRDQVADELPVARGALRHERPLHRMSTCRTSWSQICRIRSSRIPGVGQVQVFGTRYAMRIWIDPYKLNSYSLTPTDVQNAVLAQNAQVSAGELGAQPTISGQELDATVTAQSLLQTPAQFGAIILKTATGRRDRQAARCGARRIGRRFAILTKAA